MTQPLQYQRFRHNPALTGFMVLGFLFFAAGAFACSLPDQMPPGVANWDGNGNPPPVWAILAFLGFALICGLMAWISLEQVDIDAKGVTSKRPGQQARHLDWGEIHRLRERPSWQILELHGDSGQPPVRASYLLKAFPSLRAIILENATGLSSRAAEASLTDLPMRFRCSELTLFAILTICLLAAGAALLNRANPWGPGIMLVLGLVFAVGTLRAFHSLTVDHDRLILHRLIGRREIPLAEVTGVSLNDRVVAHYGLINSERRTGLVLHVKGTKPIELQGIKDTLFAKNLIEMAIKHQAAST